MVALAFTIILFVFWLILGYAVTYALNSRSDALYDALLAPVVGIAVTLLPTFWLNRLGVPIAQFAPILLPVLILLAAILLWWRRPVVPIKKYLPFAVVLLIGLLVVAQPLLYFGFDWRSYGNDDMANYVLRAMRLLNHGYFDVPTVEGIRRDYSQMFWFMDVPLRTRTGADMLLAWVVGGFGLPLQLNTLQVFMPVILAFHLALISAAGALVYSYRRYRLAALLCTGMMAFSALTLLGALYQLIAQVLGVALMAGCATLLFRPLRGIIVRPLAILRYSLLLSILITALWLVYPEITPFFVISFALYVVLGVVRRWWTLSWKSHFISFAPALFLTLIFLNSYIADYVGFLVQQTTLGIGNITNHIFPYFLQPSGLANLWGLQSISQLPAEPWLSLTIIVGGLLLIIVGAASIWLAWRGFAAATIATVMLAFAALLFLKQGGFGLFKLAMFSQPFLLATIVLFALLVIQRILLRVRIAALILLAIAGIPAIRSYTNASWGQTSEFVTFYDISNLRLDADTRNILQAHTPALVISDATNSVTGKIQALEMADVPTGFINLPLFWTMTDVDRDNPTAPCLPNKPYVPYYAECRRLSDEIYDQLKVNFVDHHDPANPGEKSVFLTFQPDVEAQQAIATEAGYWLISTAKMTVLNRSRLSDSTAQPFTLLSNNEASDVLIFIDSLVEGEVRTFSAPLGSLIKDYFFPDGRLQGSKQYLLLRAVNLSASSRLILNMTATLRGSGNVDLPLASVVGDRRYSLGVTGRGSARLFSEPLKAQTIDGLDYLLVDLGMAYTDEFLPPAQSGIMKLYGTNIRRLSGIPLVYLRDLSLISDAEFAQLDMPSRISTFPQDLANPALEYSGVYEDGWLSEHAFFGLNKASDSGDLIVRGSIPQINDPTFSTTLHLLVDGVEVAASTLQPGEFELRADSSSISQGSHHVELQFSSWQILPGGDQRPAAALLQMIGFENEG